jgi:hypothetical protein
MPHHGRGIREGLPALLSMPETVDALGADLQYELATLLIQQEGDNLRHDTAHGLLHAGQAWSAGAVYAWWLCLRLVVVPLWHMRNVSHDISTTALAAEDPRDADDAMAPSDKVISRSP